MDIDNIYKLDGEKLHGGRGKCIPLHETMWRIISNDEYGNVKLVPACPCPGCTLQRNKPEPLKCKEDLLADTRSVLSRIK